MPNTSVEALAEEVECLRNTTRELIEKLPAMILTTSRQKRMQSNLDDMENIMLAATATMPDAVAIKARKDFKRLSDELIVPETDAELLIQGLNRLNSQSEAIFNRFATLLIRGNTAGNSANAIIIAQEEERRRISREIHDGPAQTLASLTMKIDYCLEMSEVNQELAAELSDLKDAVLKSLNDIRRFIFDLRPMALDDLGLIPTLDQFISGFKKRTGISVHVNVSGERRAMLSDQELSVFRVIQEAANNAVRHANPKSIQIFLKFDSSRHRLSVVVKDDGIGFDVQEIRRSYGKLKKLGLISMEERIRTVGGEFDIVSDSGSGTVVSFWVPCE